MNPAMPRDTSVFLVNCCSSWESEGGGRRGTYAGVWARCLSIRAPLFATTHPSSNFSP